MNHLTFFLRLCNNIVDNFSLYLGIHISAQWPTHCQPGYVGNSDIHIKSVVTWQEDHSGVGSEIWLGLLCILRECGTVNWIARAEWAWSVSGLGWCDTVHILSRAAGEGTKLQCYHTNDEWCGLTHHFFKETVGKAKLVFRPITIIIFV